MADFKYTPALPGDAVKTCKLIVDFVGGRYYINVNGDKKAGGYIEDTPQALKTKIADIGEAVTSTQDITVNDNPVTAAMLLTHFANVKPEPEPEPEQ